MIPQIIEKQNFPSSRLVAGCLTKAKEPSMPNDLAITREKINGHLHFLSVSTT